MSQKYYAAEPIWLTLSGNQGRLSYWVVVRNIMRMLLMSEEGVDAETALEMMDEMPMDEFDRLKRRAAAECADPKFQDYMERISLSLEAQAPILEPVENLLYEPEEGDPVSTEDETQSRLMERLDEMDWQGFQLWELDNSCEMD